MRTISANVSETRINKGSVHSIVSLQFYKVEKQAWPRHTKWRKGLLSGCCKSGQHEDDSHGNILLKHRVHSMFMHIHRGKYFREQHTTQVHNLERWTKPFVFPELKVILERSTLQERIPLDMLNFHRKDMVRQECFCESSVFTIS